MAASPVIVRSSLSHDELTELLQTATQVFSSNPSPEEAANWQRGLTTSPTYHPEIVRAAYRGDKQLGGYLLEERLLRVGVARLKTGCIGAVHTRSEHRKQGVASALMQDAIDYAKEHDYPLLLLDGIANFYHRYGYIDVYDLSEQSIHRQAVVNLPPSSYSVRQATQDDAESILALYDRHLGPYIGSFESSLAERRHRLRGNRNGSGRNQLLLAIDPDGQARGYLSLVEDGNTLQARELAVDDWSATVALLQEHARLLEDGEGQQAPPNALTYYMPLSSPVPQWLIDTLEVPEEIAARDTPQAWSVRDQTFHQRHAAWQGRLVSLPALTRAMLPEWQERWHRALAQWTGDVTFQVEQETFALRITDTNVRLLEGPGLGAYILKLTAQRFTQSIFGYRPIIDVAQPREEPLPDDLLSVLKILFPVGDTYIPRSDWF